MLRNLHRGGGRHEVRRSRPRADRGIARGISTAAAYDVRRGVCHFWKRGGGNDVSKGRCDQKNRQGFAAAEAQGWSRSTGRSSAFGALELFLGNDKAGFRQNGPQKSRRQNWKKSAAATRHSRPIIGSAFRSVASTG